MICAVAAHDEPVAITDSEGRLRRVLRQEDPLEPIRSQLRKQSESRFGTPRGGQFFHRQFNLIFAKSPAAEAS